MAGSAIPWTKRDQIGRIKAYAQTLWIVLVRPWRVGREVARPVSLSDARRFRLLTLAIAFLGPAFLIAWVYGDFTLNHQPWPVLPSYGRLMGGRAYTGPYAPVKHRMLGWVLDAGMPVAALLGAWLFLLSASSVASCFFRAARLTSEQQHRAVAVSYYACAPWLFLPVVIPLCSWRMMWWDGGQSPMLNVILFAGVILLLLQLIGMLYVPMMLLRRATHCGIGREVAALAAMVLSWSALAGVFLIGLPAAYGFVAIMMMSLIA